jgi:ribonuclease HI
MPRITKVLIVTDGASRRNPGPAAIGFGIYDENWDLLEERAEYIGDATNNEAEYRALIEALDCATRHCRGDIEHFSDSELLVKQLNGQYKVKAQNLKPLIEKIFTEKQYFNSVVHRHLPRGNAKIQRIDNLVNQKLDEIGFK